MSDLPPGWEWSTLGEIADIQGGIQKQAKRRPVKNAYPFLRVANVTRGSLDLSDVHEIELFDGEIDRWRLRPGDLLVVEGNGSLSQLGRAAMWNDQIPNCVHQNHLIRVRPSPGIDPKYLLLLWNSDLVARQLAQVGASTSGLHTLSVAKLRPVRVPLAARAERRRIVASLDDHLSHLDASDAALSSSRRRVVKLRHSALIAARHDALRSGAPLRPISEMADTQLGKMLDARRSAGTPTAYLRNVNVRWGSIEVDDLQEVSLSVDEQLKFSLQASDVLVCEGGEPGRCAVWNGRLPGVAFQKALHRIRVRPGLLPEWLCMMLEAEVRSGRTERLLTGSTIKHLPQQKLRTIQLPVPSLPVQQALVQQFRATEDGLRRATAQGAALNSRASALRRSLLADAFAGRLVPQDPTDEPASALLERIRAERAAAPKPKRARRGPRTDPAQETLS